MSFGWCVIVNSFKSIFITILLLRIKVSNSDCLITQEGKDGLGHQLEGKLSCLLLADLLPKLKYYHTPFKQFEHISVTPHVVEQFFNLGHGTPVNSGQSARCIKGKDADHFLNNINRGIERCTNEQGVQSVDNCWDVVYKQPHASKIIDSNARKKMHQNYLLTSKPSTGFPSDRKNVFVHIRRGDSLNRALPFVYIKTAMEYLNVSLSNPIFWIDSDSPHWQGILELKWLYPNQVKLIFELDTNLKSSTSILDTFHRMVMADSIIMSYSSLSISAALYSQSSYLHIAPPKPLGDFDDNTREGFLSQKRMFYRPSMKSLSKDFMPLSVSVSVTIPSSHTQQLSLSHSNNNNSTNTQNITHIRGTKRITNHNTGSGSTTIGSSRWFESPFTMGSESHLLSFLDKAERELKVFIYPIPSSAIRCKRRCRDGRYSMEAIIPAVIQRYGTVHTTDASTADLFLIQHEWTCLLL
eukprot:gene10310-21512_t